MENIDTSEAPAFLAPDDNEESVDIYDGLDIGFSSNADKSPPSDLKESMDLFEEIVTEEQQSKESSYAELKSRYQAAQNQITEMRRRLEQLEMKNTGLNKENFHLKKNISALLQTARLEVTRKDAEIQRLNLQSERGHYHHLSRINNLRDPGSSSRTSTSSTTSTNRQPPPAPPSAPPPPLPPPLPTLPPREDRPQKVPSRKESDQPSDTEARTSKPSSHNHSRRSSRGDEKQAENSASKSSSSSTRRSESDKQSKHREEKYQSESTSRRHRTGSDPSKDCSEKNRSHKDGRRYDSKATKSRNCQNVEDKLKVATPDSEHTTKEGHVREHRKNRSSERHSRGSDSKDRKKSERHKDSSREKEGDRPSKDHPRKEERQREEETSRRHKRSMLPEKSKEKQRSKESVHDKAKHKTIRSSPKEQNVSGEENSPNRKLCFMETLNLTLSPIKKPTLPFEAIQDDPTAHENAPEDDNAQPNVEDMCVIDEVDSSELEAGLNDGADHSTDISRGRMHEKCDHDEKVVMENGNNQSDAPAADKLLEDNCVQTTSVNSLGLDAPENLVTVNLTPKSTERNCLKATVRDFSPNHEERTNQTVESRHLAAKDDASGSMWKQNTSSSLQKRTCADQSVVCNESCVLETNIESPKTCVDSATKDVAASHSQETSVVEDINKKAKLEIPQTCPTILPQQGMSLTATSSSPSKKDDVPKDADAVSSTISLESLPQEGLSLPEAIYVLTQSNDDDSSSTAPEPSSSTSCVGVSKVSSTTEEMPLPEKYAHLTVTPKKCFSPGNSRERNFEPCSSVPLLHDEDSMMRMLSNLKRIPDAISPLRSPIRIAKRSLHHVQGKPGHVKSLQKEFSSTAIDASSQKLDVNKENKYPGSPAKHDAQNLVDKVSDLPSSISDTELEEGEIVSESDEAAAASPVPATMRVKLARPIRNKASPGYVLKRKSEERCISSKEANETAGVSTRSPTIKSRFKTVCPAATKASFATIEEVMETFKLVRAEIRKKYMKLHKTFPKKSFYGVMENFQESFLEFVDGADFGQICSTAGELKAKLKKMIASVFSKVSNNGIVKRIFEQQAINLKQKLWDFVDAQVEYLFRDVYTTMKSLCKPARAPVEHRNSSENEKISRQPTAKKSQKDVQCAPTSLNQIKPCAVVPYKTGLGSRGKDIRMTYVEKDQTVDPNPPTCPNTNTVVTVLPPKSIFSTPDKSNSSSLVVSHNGPLLDKTDFELLTEQQASSLTFNLVRDSQMGEIFKCLLQGSDLLESSAISGDHTTWSLSTPRKDGERLISITTPTKFDSPSKLLSPTKFDTPSKLIATWSSISPRKVSSPRSKDQVQLNPALFDESCLLEVPSESRTVLGSQRSFSILAEDLAVSLTIPSPLKSDSHLSFLQPPSMHLVSTPDSVISAHISEDALLDGEDATEQDIHLALDTDNSSCDSNSSMALQTADTPFLFKPDLPMQALVMEKSNDHFIVKIRQAASSANTTLTANESLSQTLTEEDQLSKGEGVESQESPAKGHLSDKSENSTSPCNAIPPDNSVGSAIFQGHLSSTKDSANNKDNSSTWQITSKPSFSEDVQKLSTSPQTSDNNVHNIAQSSDHSFVQINQATTEEGVTAESQTCHKEKDKTTQESPSKAVVSECQRRISPYKSAEVSEIPQKSQILTSHTDSERDEMELTESDRCLMIAEESTPEKDQRDRDVHRKRKRNQEKSKAKRSRKDQDDSTEEMVSNANEDYCEGVSSPSLSPNSLSAKNVIRRKGEVVIAWTRDEDRAILIDLKTKGASRETFSALAEKLNKPSGQIAHRFYQLMKLFKRQEKMET